MYVWKQTFCGSTLQQAFTLANVARQKRAPRETFVEVKKPRRPAAVQALGRTQRRRCLLPVEHVMRCSVQMMSASVLNRRYVLVAGMREAAWAQKNDFKGSATQYLHKYGSRTLLYRAEHRYLSSGHSTVQNA